MRTRRNGNTHYAYQGYIGETADDEADKHPIELEIVKHTEAKRGFVLLPKRWVVERKFGWLGRFRRLARDYARLAETLNHYHWIGFLLARLRLGSAQQALEFSDSVMLKRKKIRGKEVLHRGADRIRSAPEWGRVTGRRTDPQAGRQRVDVLSMEEEARWFGCRELRCLRQLKEANRKLK